MRDDFDGLEKVPSFEEMAQDEIRRMQAFINRDLMTTDYVWWEVVSLGERDLGVHEVEARSSVEAALTALRKTRCAPPWWKFWVSYVDNPVMVELLSVESPHRVEHKVRCWRWRKSGVVR